MARTRGQGSDNEGEKRQEEQQQMPKSDENKSGSSSSSSTDSWEWARRRQLVAEGKWPILDAKKKPPLGLKLDYNAVILAWEALHGNKGIMVTSVESKANKRGRRSSAVNSNYYLRSKGMIVDAASDPSKHKTKEEETDGPVTDSEEVCKKRTKKEPINDDYDGTVCGAHTNAASEIAAGN